MKFNVQGYESIDLDLDVWKSLTVIHILQTKLKTPRISPTFLMAIRLLDRRTFETTTSFTLQEIMDVETSTLNHLKMLKSHNLIEGDNEFSIASLPNDLIALLNNQFYLSISIPLESSQIFEKIIPQVPIKRAAFTSYDDSFISLSRSFTKLTQGVFAKIGIENYIFSGVIEYGDELPQILSYLENIRYGLSRIGIKIIVLEKLPMSPISMFPLFTSGSEIIRSIKKNKSKRVEQVQLKSYLENWFGEYVKARRELADKTHRISLADPHYDKPTHVVVLIAKKLNVIASLYYASDNDRIEVQLLDEVPTFDNLRSANNLPQQNTLLHAHETYSENVIAGLGNPFVVALRDLGRIIQEFNKKARSPNFDSNDISDQKIREWLRQELETKRYLINRIGDDASDWKQWLLPISITVEYFLDDQKPNLRRSGHISLLYRLSTQDAIEVKKLEKSEFHGHIVEWKDSFFLESQRDLLGYMMETMGEYSASYF